MYISQFELNWLLLLLSLQNTISKRYFVVNKDFQTWVPKVRIFNWPPLRCRKRQWRNEAPHQDSQGWEEEHTGDVS